jgi:hypothetical protein
MRHPNKALLLISMLAVVATPFSVHALLGVGGHYGIDYSLDMKPLDQELVFEDYQILDPHGTVIDEEVSVWLSLDDWQPVTRFGGKLYADQIPVVDAVEASFNFGVWEYGASMSMEKVRKTTSGLERDTLSVSFLQSNLPRLGFSEQTYGVDKIPFAKLQIDLTVRKYLVQFPPVLKTAKLYVGGGFSFYRHTRLLSPSMVRDELSKMLPELPQDSTASFYQDDPVLDDIASRDRANTLLRSLNGGMTEGGAGVHLVTGLGVKIPVVPLLLYVDTKFMAPFSGFDEEVKLGGFGFLISTGAAFHL